jgi:hypothetical protein
MVLGKLLFCFLFSVNAIGYTAILDKKCQWIGEKADED